MSQNPFDHYSSHNARINILLENFHFFHRPITSTPCEKEKEDPKYIGKSNPMHQLYNWIKYNEAESGSYLVTGYRGAGKSSLVGKLMKTLQQEEKQDDTTHYIPLTINLGQENIEEIEILRIIVKRLLSKLMDENRWIRLYYLAKHYLFLWLIMFVAISVYFFQGNKENKENLEYIVLAWAILLGILIAGHLLSGSIAEVRAIVKLRNIVQRLNASIQIESDGIHGLEWNGLKSQMAGRQSRNIMPATVQEIEYDLIEALDLIRKSREKRKIIIIFDELDKTDSAKRPEQPEGLPEFEKLSIRPEQKVSSRTRKQEVLRIIANMKFFLSTAKAYFIFIAGREMYEAYQADMSDRDFSISSIFSGVINVDSFLTSSRNTNNSNQMTEQFICKQLMPPHIKDLIEHSTNHLYDKKNIYSLKNYYNYRIKTGERYYENEWNAEGKPNHKLYRQRIWKETLFLYHFISYLTYVSNGSPKKMTLFFEKNIRKGEYLEKEKKIGRIYQWKNEKKERCAIKETDVYLSFGYYTQEKVNFIHHLTYPIIQTIINRSNLYGDKLLVSSSFLISHIFKLHNNGFSWCNLEQTPELLEINKTPEIREYIGSIIDFMNHTHLTSIACGLFHYKFPMRIAEEISYHSKISGEVSALFNFSLDEMQSIKNHYIRVLKYNEHEHNATQYSQASIHHSLGDIYMQEENYSDAIREYEKSMECVTPIIERRKAGIQQLNYISFMNRTMLKLGLAHEKRRTDNSAFIVYEELIRLLKEFAVKDKILFNNMRTFHLSLIARLYALEKIDTSGICYKHLSEACDNFHKMFGTRSNSLIAADFYRKLGEILFYKNLKHKGKKDYSE